MSKGQDDPTPMTQHHIKNPLMTSYRFLLIFSKGYKNQIVMGGRRRRYEHWGIFGACRTLKGFHHPGGSQQAFLTGLAHLYNLIPYQRRSQHAGQCGVEVEGGTVPTRDWFLNVQILTSGGFR